jgi:putative two-component system response regulator
LGSVLIVDDLAGSARLAQTMLASDGHTTRTAEDGAEALRLVGAEAPDLILMDVMMPNLDGFEACRILKRDSDTRLIPIVLVTALDDTASRLRGIDAGADDFVTKPFNALELRARVRSLLRMKRYTDELDSAESVIVSLALTIEARDSTTGGHCQRLSTAACALGQTLGLNDDALSTLARGGFLHDLGKVGIPDAVLMKRGPLTVPEQKMIQQHPVIGDRLCGQMRLLRSVRPIVRHHHERLDGSGYPDGLRGDAVPLLAQILSIVDAFDAMTTVRPYADARPVEFAAGELRDEAARGWRSPALVATFLCQVDAAR